MNAKRRIFVFGGFCSGKTFLSRSLAKQLKIKALHLDDVFWFGAWQHIGMEELLGIAKTHTKNEQWIIEGNYEVIREYLWKSCTQVIYLDISPWIATWRALKRCWSKQRQGVPLKVRESGCREPAIQLVKNIWWYYKKNRRDDLHFIDMISNHQIQIAVIRNNKKYMEVLKQFRV